jgi:hypothetical protein
MFKGMVLSRALLDERGRRGGSGWRWTMSRKSRAKRSVHCDGTVKGKGCSFSYLVSLTMLFEERHTWLMFKWVA